MLKLLKDAIKYRRLIPPLLKLVWKMREALEDGYVTRAEATRIGYGVEEIYRAYQGEPDRTEYPSSANFTPGRSRGE